MPIYYMLLDAKLFHGQIRPALAASWRERSFDPCRAVCRALLPAARSFMQEYHAGPTEPLLCKAADGLAFDRYCWTLLVGEILLFAALEIPEIQIAPETLCCLLAPEHYRKGDLCRELFAPIQQAHYGSQELTFGHKTYRPEFAGLNDSDDVSRLSDYLADQQPAKWPLTALSALREVADDSEREEELEFAREWFPALQDLYRRARLHQQVIICESL
jgi:hypothetical protein